MPDDPEPKETSNSTPPSSPEAPKGSSGTSKASAPSSHRASGGQKKAAAHRSTSPESPPKKTKESSSVPSKTAEKKRSPSPTPAARPPSSKPPAPPPGTVVDATGLVLGRAASRIAKRLLEGERIIVVNAEKSVVTGSRGTVLEFYRANRARGSKRSGPHYPRYPDRIFRRTVRGMLPHLKTRGRDALDRLDVYIGLPAAFAGVSRQSIDEAHPSPSLRTPITLEEITRLLGARL